MGGCADSLSRLHRRAAELAASFAAIAQTRMADLPLLNTALQVEAVGFRRWPSQEGEAPAGLGILITPWFMNLIRLPLQRDDSVAGIGRADRRALGGAVFEFIGAHEPALGAFSACSLFSPMFEFADPAGARATAVAVLAALEPLADAPVPPPARRAFLLGRGGAPGAAR